MELWKTIQQYSQEADTCDGGGDVQSLQIETEDGGAGKFIIFSTKRWALDASNIDEFANLLKRFAGEFCREVPGED